MKNFSPASFLLGLVVGMVSGAAVISFGITGQEAIQRCGAKTFTFDCKRTQETQWLTPPKTVFVDRQTSSKETVKRPSLDRIRLHMVD